MKSEVNRLNPFCIALTTMHRKTHSGGIIYNEIPKRSCQNMKMITTEMISEYKSYLIEEEKGTVTIEKYIRDVTTFYRWIGSSEITKSKMLEYKAELIEKYAPATVNSILSSLNSFFGHYEWYELRVKNLKIQRQMFCKSETELTKDEYERLLRAAKYKKNERLYLIMQTICSTGIRVVWIELEIK